MPSKLAPLLVMASLELKGLHQCYRAVKAKHVTMKPGATDAADLVLDTSNFLVCCCIIL